MEKGMKLLLWVKEKEFCGQCVVTKSALQARNIEFGTAPIDAEENTDKLNEFKEAGHMSMPILVGIEPDGTETVLMVGFHIERINELF